MRRPLCLFCGSPAVAFDIHLEDRRVVDEPVDGGQCHCRVRKDRIPFPERLVGRDQHGAAFVSCTDEFEEHAGLGLVLGDVGDVIEDEQVELIEFRDCTFEDEIAARLLELLDQIGGAGEEDAVTVLDKCEHDGGAEMRLAYARRAKQHDVAALSDPTVTRGNGADMGLGRCCHVNRPEVAGSLIWG